MPKKKAGGLQQLKSMADRCGSNRVLNSINRHIYAVYMVWVRLCQQWNLTLGEIWQQEEFVMTLVLTWISFSTCSIKNLWDK